MIATWRWFGKDDSITLPILRQIGVEGIVTALHHVPNGEVWTSEDILETKSYIESHQLKWSVVESLPVSEAIKYAGREREELIDNYITSLTNLGKAGIKTVCYNFMPVLDWARTDLNHPWPDGSSSLYFDKIRFAYFDIYILERRDAQDDYLPEEVSEAEQLRKTITKKEKEELVENIIIKTQGFVNGNISENDHNPIAKFKRLLALYDDIDKQQLRDNMTYFLQRIMPVCEEHDISMCVHPDDPPFPLLGLPRIVTNEDDISWILHSVDHPCNGLTFCAGSLSANLNNDITTLANRFASRTKFLHLRSTKVFPNGNFIEAPHLEGRGNLVDVVRIFEQKNPGLPMRIDHGRLMLDDADKGYHPGYSFHGRMLALGQLQGVIATVKNELAGKKTRS